MKKRFLWLIPAGYFPYHVLLWVRLMRRGVFGVLYENAAPKVLGSFGVVYLTALIGVLACSKVARPLSLPFVLAEAIALSISAVSYGIAKMLRR